VAVVLLVAAWVGAGVHRLDPDTEFGVVCRRWPATPWRLVEHRRFLIAPPGWYRAGVFPRGPMTLPLPGAARAMLPSADGTRFGLVGTAVVSAPLSRAADLGAAANGGGLPTILMSAIEKSASVLSDADRDERGIPTRRRAFENALRGELDARGAALEALELSGFEDLIAGKPVADPPRDVKVLVVGLDGADWRIIDPLMAEGRMPHMRRLVEGGARADLLTITPMLSPVIWTTIATGVEPARHGVMDFLAPGPNGASEPVTSAARRAPAIWELLSEAGVRVGVTGWWATWPAEPVNGYMVTDRVAYQLFGYSSDPRSATGKTWPPDAYKTVQPLIVPTDAIPWNQVTPYLEGTRRRPDAFDADERERLDEFRTLLAAGTTYLHAALAMRSKENPAFETVYFEGTDTIGHLFMSYRPPRLASVDPEGFDSFRMMVDRYYENADRMLGELLEGREGWTVIVVSDHGFASDATRPLSTDSRIGHGAAADWHRRFGVFVINGPGIKRGARLEQASVYDVAPTILALFHQPVPRSWPGRVLGRAMTPDLLAAFPVRLRADDPVRRGDGEAAIENQAESQELREKLQSLGYLGATPSAPMTTKNNRGVSLLAAGKFEEAAAAFRDALADRPGQSTVMVNLGIALRFAGHRAEAKELFDRAFETPSGRRSAGHQLAQLAMDDGDLNAAEKYLRTVLVAESGAAEIRNALGLVLEKRGRLDEAGEQYAEAARLDPNAAEPRNNLGNLARRRRDTEAAERWYLAAIAADPYSMGAYNNLALLCQDRGQIDRAIDLYGRALAKAPRNAVVMNNLASLYFANGENREARALWRKAVEADPKYASPLNNLAGLALSEGDNAAAGELLDRALALDPGYGDAHINRSLLDRRRGDLPAARRELEEAAKDPRSSGTAREELGFLELALGRPEEAVVSLEAARKELGDRVHLLNALADAYERLGRRDRARTLIARSLELQPAQPELRDALIQLDNQK
jgi:Flp pilus assembly protein TadD/arylsulfatase A-like enzyme